MATERQEAVFNKILENPGMAVSKAMEQVGYSPGQAKNPQALTRSKGWKELMEEYVPESLLAEKLHHLLKSNSDKAIKDGLDMAFKIRGKYAAIKVQLEDPYDKLSDEELDAKIAELQTLKKGEPQVNG